MGQSQYRRIPKKPGPWKRAGNIVRVKLIDLEPGLPDGLELERISGFAVACCGKGAWEELPSSIDYCNGYGRWVGGNLTEDSCICFHAPRAGTKPRRNWDRSSEFDGWVDLDLWDSRCRRLLHGIRIFWSTQRHTTRRPPAIPLRLQEIDAGFVVAHGKTPLLRFDSQKGYQITSAKPPKGKRNLVPPGSVWRWLPTESSGELTDCSGDRVIFTPLIREGIVLVVAVSGSSHAGDVEATLRMFLQNRSLVLEFSDYRAHRTRPELPPAEHPRSYAGQIASPYPGIHYAAFMLSMEGEGIEVCDHLFKHETIKPAAALELVYEGPRKQTGWNWLALRTDEGSAALCAHGRTHYPDHPFKAGIEQGRTIVALEPFGSEVDGHYSSCDRYTLVIGKDIEAVRETFDTLDTFPILVRTSVKRDIGLLDTYACLGKWVNLNLHHVMRTGQYRNAIRTDGTFRDDRDTCVVAIGEMIRLYEKTACETFLTAASEAAQHAAHWILEGRFDTRGHQVGANGGGIYQNEQIYLLLSLARTYTHTHDPLLGEAVEHGVRWMDEHRGGEGTWGWENFSWHAGGCDAQGKPLYFWPVNTNQFATLNFRLGQILGERKYYENAMEIMEQYRRRLRPGTREVIQGGGVSDTTRGVHLFAEAIEVAGGDPRIDRAFLERLIEETLERFWIEGWALIRNTLYGESITPGSACPDIFSPGFKHWHNCGSYLDILPRIAVAAEVGVSEHLTRWAARDFIYDFDSRYGMEEHTHMARYSLRDTDIEPGCWLDCEVLPALHALRKRMWIDHEDFTLMLYKVNHMIQRSFLSLDEDHGGWAGTYESAHGRPIKYLSYWERRHSHEAFANGEPLELWGVPPREAFCDHSSHYWSALEQLVDMLLRAETVSLPGNRQVIRCFDDGLFCGMACRRPVLVRKEEGAQTILLDADTRARGWEITEQRTIVIDSTEFWLLAMDQKPRVGGTP